MLNFVVNIFFRLMRHCGFVVSGTTMTPRKRQAAQAMTHRTGSLPRMSSQPSSTNNSPTTSPKLPRAADRRPSLGADDKQVKPKVVAAAAAARDVSF